MFLLFLAGLLLLGALLFFAANLIEAQAAAERVDGAMEMLRHMESCEAPIDLTEGDPAAAPEDMPVVYYNGYDYIGYLDLPSLELELPVMSSYSESQLELSPCRYSGSLETGDLILTAKNDSHFFGKLKRLSPGDELSFTDGDQVRYTYRVSALETLDTEEPLEAGNWDLTLFTDTLGGHLAVRCSLVA
jgi:sortase A